MENMISKNMTFWGRLFSNTKNLSGFNHFDGLAPCWACLKTGFPRNPQVGTISAAKVVGLLRCHYDSHLDPELIFLVHHSLATPTWLLDSRCSPRKLPCVLGAKTAGDGDGRCHSHGFHGPGYLWWNLWWNARTASDASGEPAA